MPNSLVNIGKWSWAIFEKKQKSVLISTLVIALASGFGGAAWVKAGPVSPLDAFDKKAKKIRKPLEEWSADTIIKNFMFVGDFEQKEATRSNSKEVFWRYPFTLPKIKFPLDLNEDLSSAEILAAFPKTEGSGRAIQHLNRGRIAFLEGNFEEARKTWLGARARYGSGYDFHRRADYFIAQSLLYKGWAELKKSAGNFETFEVRQNFVNANTFLSWAFDRKKDIPDLILDQFAPRSFYNQAAIYFTYNRWAGASGALSNGLDFLRKNGRKEYRPDMRRMMAEIHILDRSYLNAVQELDLSLRQDGDPKSAAAIFARIGDIYFDLNNFELAEEVYAAANHIDRDLKQIRPSQYVLRGESLFWLGKFDESRLTMAYALQAASLPQSKEDLDENMQALASMRIADSWLALGKFEQAKLAYFRHSQEHRSHSTTNFAKIRLACLELPEYEGNNILHARNLLIELKDQFDLIPPPAQEMAWTCETASYAQHERTPEMVEKVRAMAHRYPDSALLASLADPVRAVQARKIDEYFAANDLEGAVQFFEKTRNFLYPVVADELAIKLFSAYADLNFADKAKEFLPVFAKSVKNERGWIQTAAVLIELIDGGQAPEQGQWRKHNRELAKKMLDLPLQLKLEKENRLYLHRIMGRPSGQEHYPWILATGLQWLASDISIGCDIVYPTLQRMQENKQFESISATDKKAIEFIDKSLKDLLRFETNCAYSLMEFEIELHKTTMAILAKRYLTRDYIVLNPQTAAIIWAIAEQTHVQGDQVEAEALWQLLSSKGSPELAEVRYARSRLNNQPTQLEGLWRN